MTVKVGTTSCVTGAVEITLVIIGKNPEMLLQIDVVTLFADFYWIEVDSRQPPG